jgi:DNA-binding CsgD family transcriptional regulator
MNPSRADAFGDSSPMFEVIERIYAAAQDATQWPAALGAISEAVGGESIALYAGFPNARTPDLYAFENVSPDAWQEFAEYYAAINPIMAACEAMFTPDVPWVSDLAVADATFERTEFYNDFYRPNDMQYSLGLRLELPNLPSASLSCQRAKALGSFGAAEIAVFQTLLPHLRRALQIHHRLSGLEAKAIGLETALDAYDHAVVGLDRLGRVCMSNNAALKLFSLGDGLHLVAGRLCCVRPEENALFQQKIASLAGVQSVLDDTGDTLSISRRSGVSNLQLTILPMNKTMPGRSAPLAAMVFITDGSVSSSRSSLIRKLYRVTPSEARVADLLLQGLDLREISDKLRITLETTRFQSKRLLTKTGTRRQAELLRLLAALPSVDVG